MGLSPGKSWSSYDVTARLAVAGGSDPLNGTGNPNPQRFVIYRWAQVGRSVVVLAEYPDARNYEGQKILVYEDVSIEEITSWDRLDPHFSAMTPERSPVARFLPTNRGWTWALEFASRL